VRFLNGKGFPRDRAPHDGKRKTEIQPMEKVKRARKIPQSDSIDKLARFWDTHDLTEFEDQLEDVRAPVFERETSGVIAIRLHPQEAEAVKEAAKARGVRQATLIRQWVRDKLRSNSSLAKRS
jgi:predicted DNA binding CopG/RHH family protein